MRLSAVPAAVLLAALAAAALLAGQVVSVGVIAAVLLLVCARAPAGRRGLYLFGALSTGFGVFVLSPFLWVEGSSPLWSGPVVPVLGRVDITVEELEIAALNGLRLAALGLAFAA